jgi:hypothetical protein
VWLLLDYLEDWKPFQRVVEKFEAMLNPYALFRLVHPSEISETPTIPPTTL